MQIVFANFDRLVVNTKKTSLERAGTYAGFIIDTIKGRNVLMFLDIRISRMWEHVQWLDLHNYGGFHICQSEDAPDNDKWFKDNALLNSEEMMNEMNWNISEYLPEACREVFLKTVGEYLTQIIEYDDDAEDAENAAPAHGSTRDNGESVSPKARFFQDFVKHKLKRRLLKEIPRLNRDWIRLKDVSDVPEEEVESARLFEIPSLPGSYTLLLD